MKIIMMKIITASKASKNLYQLMDQVAGSHQPNTITGKHHDAILLPLEDW